MKTILHAQQMGKRPYTFGDWIVQGRDEFHDDLQLWKVVGTWGHKQDAAMRLWGVPLEDLTLEGVVIDRGPNIGGLSRDALDDIISRDSDIDWDEDSAASDYAADIAQGVGGI